MISSMARRWPAIAKAQKLRNRRDFCWRSLFSRKHKKQLLKASVGSGKQRKKLSPTTTHSFRWLNLADRSQPPKLYHWCPLHLGMKPTKVQALAWTVKKFSFFPLTFFPTLLFCSLRESRNALFYRILQIYIYKFASLLNLRGGAWRCRVFFRQQLAVL